MGQQSRSSEARAPERRALPPPEDDLEKTPVGERAASMWDRMVAELDRSVLDSGEDLEPSPELAAKIQEIMRARQKGEGGGEGEGQGQGQGQGQGDVRQDQDRQPARARR
jgi:hypothetical protein